MTDKLFESYNAALRERVGDLASASDAGDVREVLADAKAEAVGKAFIPDTFVYKATVIVLGTSVIVVVLAQLLIALEIGHDKIPDGIIAIGSAAIGALAGLLAPAPNA
jgi:hypothetical protein